MIKTSITLFALTLLPVPASVATTDTQNAQSACTLTEANAPGVRGLKLGMSTEQLLTLFPGSTKREEVRDALESAKRSGGSETVYIGFEPRSDVSGSTFAETDSIGVALQKGRVVQFVVQYAGPSWRDIDEWIAKLSETLKLPGAGEWEPGQDETPSKFLKCRGVEIEAAVQGGGASIRVWDTAAFKSMGTKSGDEQKRKVFKP